MFQELSKYLYTYKEVSIPEIGSFRLKRQAASFDVADQLLHPPAYTIEHSLPVNVEKHQLVYLAEKFNTDTESIQEELLTFGNAVKKRVRQGSFSWNGVGRLEGAADGISFQPYDIVLNGLKPVPAKRVVRQNVTHTVLIGEQEVQASSNIEASEEVNSKKRSILVIIGWIIALLALAFIVFHFYREGFKPAAGGSKLKVGTERSLNPFK